MADDGSTVAVWRHFICLLAGHKFAVREYGAPTPGWVYKCQRCGHLTRNDGEVFPDVE